MNRASIPDHFSIKRIVNSVFNYSPYHDIRFDCVWPNGIWLLYMFTFIWPIDSVGFFAQKVP